jgi:hypothetical protein
MATVTKAPKARKPAPKPERRVRLIGADDNPMLVEMTIGKESFAYFVKKIHADFGMGFEFRKIEVNGMSENSDETYHVHYDPARRSSTCDCLGGLHHGHCKHQEAIVALINSGKIAVPAPKQPESKPQETRCPDCGELPRDCYCGFDAP